MNVYDIDAFLANKEDREYSWRWQKESPVWNAQPGTAHKALVKLEQAGMLTLLATQNFDALHEKAGNSSNVIVNLHGTIGTSHCMKCHAKYNTADIMANLDNEPDPHCHRRLPYNGNMPCNGLIKTDVVYFGEALPDGALEKSYRLATQADELWVIGSTLEVMPAASIVPLAAEARSIRAIPSASARNTRGLPCGKGTLRCHTLSFVQGVWSRRRPVHGSREYLRTWKSPPPSILRSFCSYLRYSRIS